MAMLGSLWVGGKMARRSDRAGDEDETVGPFSIHPVLDLEPLHAAESLDVVGDHYRAQAAGMRRDQQIVRADPLSAFLQVKANFRVVPSGMVTT